MTPAGPDHALRLRYAGSCRCRDRRHAVRRPSLAPAFAPTLHRFGGTPYCFCSVKQSGEHTGAPWRLAPVVVVGVVGACVQVVGALWVGVLLPRNNIVP